MSTTITSSYSKPLIISGYDNRSTVSLKAFDATERDYKVAELLAALKAEGLLVGEFITNLPTAHWDDQYLSYVADGLNVRSESPELLRRMAAAHLSVAEFIEAERAAAARATEAAEAIEAKRNSRRDDLAKELSTCGYDYLGAAPILRTAIDRIINLEDRVAGAS